MVIMCSEPMTPRLPRAGGGATLTGPGEAQLPAAAAAAAAGDGDGWCSARAVVVVVTRVDVGCRSVPTMVLLGRVMS